MPTAIKAQYLPVCAYDRGSIRIAFRYEGPRRGVPEPVSSSAPSASRSSVEDARTGIPQTARPPSLRNVRPPLIPAASPIAAPLAASSLRSARSDADNSTHAFSSLRPRHQGPDETARTRLSFYNPRIFDQDKSSRLRSTPCLTAIEDTAERNMSDCSVPPESQ